MPFSSTFAHFRFYNDPVKKPRSAKKTPAVRSEETLSFLESRKQDHILDHYAKLSSQGQKALLADMGRLDLNLAFDLYEKFSRKKQSAPEFRDLHPAPVIPICRNPEEERSREESYRVGESLICSNKVACLLVGRRAGHTTRISRPEGKVPDFSGQKKAPLSNIRRVAPGFNSPLPGYDPSPHHDQQGKRGGNPGIFREQPLLRLGKRKRSFLLPGHAADPERRREAHPEKSQGAAVANPDGHGGSLKALHESGDCFELSRKKDTRTCFTSRWTTPW